MKHSVTNQSEVALQDAAYHLTGQKRIGSILTAGLRPNPERGEEPSWQRLEAFVDDARPEKVRHLGITRRHSIYAHPDIEMLNFPSAMGNYRTLRRDTDSSVAIEVMVDPNRVLVSDAWLLGHVRDALQEESLSVAQRYAREYWDQSVTLAEYRKFYIEPKYSQFGAEHARKPDAPSNVPAAFLQPEVLIPNGVNPEMLRWVASSTIKAME